MVTGSGAGVASQRTAWRQKNSCVRSVDDSIIFQRHDASPAKIIERPRPYC